MFRRSPPSAAVATTAVVDDDDDEKTNVSFLVFISTLFDQVGDAQSRPLSDIFQTPAFPIRTNYQYRIQVNLLWYLRSYLNFFLLSSLLACLFMPWLAGAVALALALHLDSAAATRNSNSTAAAAASSSSTTKLPPPSPTSAAVASAVAAQAEAAAKSAAYRHHALSIVQAIYLCFLFYTYGFFRIFLLMSAPVVAVLLHATFIPYTDAASRAYELHLARSVVPAAAAVGIVGSGSGSGILGGGATGGVAGRGSNDNASSNSSSKNNSGNRGSGPGSARVVFKPARPSTPVRRWRHDSGDSVGGSGSGGSATTPRTPPAAR